MGLVNRSLDPEMMRPSSFVVRIVMTVKIGFKAAPGAKMPIA
jgi:hypothetical protein